MTETAPVPEMPTNVKLQPASSENDPNASNAPPCVVTEGPAEPVPLVAVKTEAAAAGAAEMKKEEPAVAVKTEAAVKTEEPAAGDLAKIKQLLEFYFGDANYRRDKFLQNEAAKDPKGALMMAFGSLSVVCVGMCVLCDSWPLSVGASHAGGPCTNSSVVLLGPHRTPTGFIKITTLLTFNKLKTITTDPAVVARAVDGSSDAAKSALIVVCMYVCM